MHTKKGEWMTIETLEKYRGISLNAAIIQNEINALYDPIVSPNGKSGGSGSRGTPGNPTEQAVFRILKLKEKLSEALNEQVTLLEEIVDWMTEVEKENPEVVALIRMHYVAGLTWKETNIRAYGYKSKHTARKKVARYFGKKM